MHFLARPHENYVNKHIFFDKAATMFEKKNQNSLPLFDNRRNISNVLIKNILQE